MSKENPAREDFLMMMEAMEKIESTRMGLWYIMTARGNGHLAHAIIGHGFRCLEYLRWLDKPLWNQDQEGFEAWGRVRDKYVDALNATALVLQQTKGSGEGVRKVQNHVAFLLSLGYAPGYAPVTARAAEEPQRPPVQGATEKPAVAPSAAAQNTSPPTCSVAGSIGTPSTPPTGQSSGGPSTGGGKGKSTEMNSEEFKKASSRNMKKTRGTGHPKRSNPYTRGKKGKA